MQSGIRYSDSTFEFKITDVKYFLELYKENNYHKDKFGKIRSGVVWGDSKKGVRIWRDRKKGYMYQIGNKKEQTL